VTARLLDDDPVAGAPLLLGAAPRARGPGGTAEFSWRYWLAGEPTVSVYRPAVTRSRSTPAR